MMDLMGCTHCKVTLALTEGSALQVAVMVTVPAAFALMEPVLFTVAMLSSEEVQISSLLSAPLGSTVALSLRAFPSARAYSSS